VPAAAGFDDGEEIRLPPLGDESRGLGGEFRRDWPTAGGPPVGWAALLVREGHVVHLVLGTGREADPRLDVVWAVVAVLARNVPADAGAVARLPGLGDLPDGYHRPHDTVHEVGG
jgi:hypothetical protein